MDKNVLVIEFKKPMNIKSIIVQNIQLYLNTYNLGNFLK